MKLAQLGIFNSVKGQQHISLSGRTTLRACGDSITLAQGATTQSEGYIQQFATAKGLTLTNQAVGARGVWNQQAAMQTASFTHTSALITVMVGLNDMKRNGSASKTVNKIRAGFRAIGLKAIAQSFIYSGSASVTRSSGTFTAYAANTVGGAGVSTGGIPGANVASFSATNGATWSYTFTGTAIGVSLIGADGTTYNNGVCEIRIDGVLMDTVDLDDYYDAVSDGAYDNGRGPVPFVYFGLTNASHTITVINISANAVPIDYFATIRTPANSAAVLFAEIPYCTATGYLSPPNGSIAASDICSAAILEECNRFRDEGYTFAYVNTNRYYDPVNSGDGTHPDNAGYDQITNAFNAAII